MTPGDRRRLFVTAWLVYGLFLNPVLVNPMTWSALDAAASLVELWSRPAVTGAPAPQALAP